MTTKCVLIIDDEDPVVEVVRSCFEDVAEWQVLVASSAQEGLQKAIAEQPGAIVLDVMMPGTDGLAFLQQLKTNPATQTIPVILLTARAELTHPQQVRKLGIAGAIAKPFDPMEFTEQVAAFLGWTLGE